MSNRSRAAIKVHVRRSKKRIIALVLAVLLLGAGAYLLLLVFAPSIPFLSQPHSIVDNPNDTRNRLLIDKIDLEVPYFSGDVSVLNDGAWWRHPERGNPKKGGNFILSAHRFELGLTPQGTRMRSPFYHLDRLEAGDTIRVMFEEEWYEYKVTRRYDVDRNAIEIEAPIDDARLTLYTCSLRGEADGRVVIEARPVD